MNPGLIICIIGFILALLGTILLRNSEKRKNESQIITSQPKTSYAQRVSTTEFFNSMGATMSQLWKEFLIGQNRAVLAFDKYKTFQKYLSKKYDSIDFNRTINFQLENETFVTEVKYAMYLYLIKLKKDFYISTEEENTPYLLPLSEYNNIVNALSKKEISYCDELYNYISEHICKLVNETGYKKFGIEKICKRIIPVNSLELYKYHKFIAEETHSKDSEDYQKWHYINSAPIFFDKNSVENPLIILSVTAVTSLVLDYLCYATMSLPTETLIKIINYKSEQGWFLKEELINKFGQKAFDYLLEIIDDMNGSMFRISVYEGLKMT